MVDENKPRFLTLEEKIYARSIFGDSIKNLDKITIHPNTPVLIKDHFFDKYDEYSPVPSTKGYNIYYPPNYEYYDKNFGKLNNTTDPASPGALHEKRGTFIHELVHVWQHQFFTSKEEFRDAGRGQTKNYSYSSVWESGFKSLGFEAQAQFIEDMVELEIAVKANGGTDGKHDFIHAGGKHELSEYKKILKDINGDINGWQENTYDTSGGLLTKEKYWVDHPVNTLTNPTYNQAAQELYGFIDDTQGSGIGPRVDLLVNDPTLLDGLLNAFEIYKPGSNNSGFWTQNMDVSFWVSYGDSTQTMAGDNFAVRSYADKSLLQLYQRGAGDLIGLLEKSTGESILSYKDGSGHYVAIPFLDISQLTPAQQDLLLEMTIGVNTAAKAAFDGYVESAGNDTAALTSAALLEIAQAHAGRNFPSTFDDSIFHKAVNIDGNEYFLNDVAAGLQAAATAIASFVQDQISDASRWLTSADGAGKTINLWLMQNGAALISGDIDGDEALISLAKFMGEKYLAGQIVSIETKFEAERVINGILQREFDISVDLSAKVTKSIVDSFNNMALELAFHSDGWNREDYAKAGLTFVASSVGKVIAADLFPDLTSKLLKQGSTGVGSAIISLSLQLFSGDLGPEDIIQVGLQLGISEALTLLGPVLPQIPPVWGIDPVTIVASVVLNLIASKILSSLFGSKVFHEGEFPSKLALINSLYQVVDITLENGQVVKALAAVHEKGSTIIMQGGIVYGLGGDGSDILVGDGNGIVANNVFFGGGGGDYLEGRAGNDGLFGEDGNDHLAGGSGDDVLNGGTGNDEIFGDEGADIIQGDDTDPETEDGDDFIHSGSGDDVIGAHGGDDIVLAGTDDDAAEGGDGDDIVELGHGDDAADGGAGSDIVLGNIGNDAIDGGAGDDQLWGEEGNDHVTGGDGDDYASGGRGIDVLEGGAGDDVLSGGMDNDILDGSLGEDALRGGFGNDVLMGGFDNDLLLGEDGDDTLQGDAGDDVLVAGAGDNNLDGSAGDDKLVFGGTFGNHIVSDSAGTDSVILDGISSASISIAAGTGDNSNDLIITFGANDSTVTIKGQLAAGGPVIERLELADGYVALSGVTGNSFSVQNYGGGVLSSMAGITTQIEDLDTLEDQKLAHLNNNKTLAIIGQQTYNEALQGQIENTYYNGSEIEMFSRGRGLLGSSYDIYRLKKVGDLQGDSTVYAYKELGEDDDGSLYDRVVTAEKVTFDNGQFVIEDLWIENQIAATTIIQNGRRIDADAGETFRNYNLSGKQVITAEQRRVDGGNVTSVTLGENLVTTGIDKFVGSYWNEKMSGHGAADYLFGGEGDDTLDGGDGGDWLFGSGGNDKIDAGGGNDLALGGAGNDNISGGVGDDGILGGEGDDTVSGGSGDDWIDGGTGNDSISGGSGNDALQGGAGTDTASFAGATSGVTANLATGVATGEGADTLFDIENLVGTAYVDTLTGDAGNNTLDGGAGADSLAGGDGNDTFLVDNAGDTVSDSGGADIVISSVTYTLASGIEALTLTGSSNIHATGSSGHDTLTGNSGNNSLSGGDGNDTLNGGAGTDTLSGGANDDTYIVDSVTDTISDSSGSDTVVSSVTYTLGSGLENLTLSGSGNITAVGNSGKNTLTGNSGTNALTGGQDDDYYIVGTGDTVTETSSVGAGTDTVEASVTWTLGSNIENLVLSGTTALDGTGNTLNNSLTGNTGANTLSGGTGADTMAGGAGDDAYIVDNAGDIVSENNAEGMDSVESSLTFTLGSNVENLTLTAATAINGTGNVSDNTIIGGGGVNIITGGGGNDYLDGGVGADTMRGGSGNDTYVVSVATDVITIDATYETGGTDTVLSAVAWTLASGLENLTLTGASVINGTGNSGDNTIVGNSAKNVLTGNGGHDTLDGGSAGADTMSGGTGDDVYVVNTTTTVVSENASEGADRIESIVSYTIASNVESLVLTGSGDINATGNSSANILTGNSGSNTLNGSTGADVMTGGAGDDTYVVDDSGDTVTESDDGGIDTVNASVNYSLGDFVENLTLTGSINGEGNGLDNTITGGTGTNSLTGGAGNDVFYVSTGDIVIEDSAGGNDSVYSDVTYTLTDLDVENLTLTGTGAINANGNTSNNTLIGGTGVNIITGNGGNDYLDGGAGADTMFGGSGNDTYVVSVATDKLDTSAESGGTDIVISAVTWTLSAGFENLTLTGAGAINGIGNTSGNTLTGGAGVNTLSGGAGNDSYYVGTGDIVSESAAAGTDTVFADLTWTLASNVENLTMIGTANISGTGNSDGNTILGNDGDNTLNGGAGADVMQGGKGNDTYIVDSTSDGAAEGTDAGGTDTVESSVTFTLGDNLENLTLTGSSAITGVGNAGNNTLTANSGINTLQGADGNDSYVVDSTTDIIVETQSGGTDTILSSVSFNISDVDNIENLTLTGAATIDGTGNALANTLIGNSAANALAGGEGDDVYFVGAGDEVFEEINNGTDTVSSDVTYALGANIEALVMTGSESIHATGNDLANVITGNTGNNTLDGGKGSDSMAGGAGNDTYFVDDAGDEIAENSGEGSDTVYSAVASYTLASHLENLVLSGTAIMGVGNAQDNILTGNTNDNTLDGASGSDTATGGLGNDTYYIDSTGDLAVEAADEGIDTAHASVTYTLASDIENLVLEGLAGIGGIGNTLNNTIEGNEGSNDIDGGIGADVMQGGKGDDSYTVDDTADIIIEVTDEGTDTVTANIHYTLADTLENLTLSGTANINATGNAANNLITGNSGDNLMIGLGGDDTYVWTSGDTVVEVAGGGTDTVQSATNANLSTISTAVENLVLTGSGDVSATGNDLDNTITGNSGNNTLSGGNGDDTVSYMNATFGVSINLGAGTASGFGTDALTGFEVAIGSIYEDTLTGTSGADTLDGYAGGDTMIGGSGNDTFIVDAVDDVVSDSSGTDTVRASVSYTLGSDMENLVLTGAAFINATGNDSVNILTGNDGANTLDGGDVADTMIGGRGNDSYVVDDGGDVVSENADEGSDTVISSITYTLGAQLENLTLAAGATIDGTGNGLDNILTGNDNANTLAGAGGNDTLDGKAGADYMAGGDGDDTYVVGSETDVVAENDGEGDDVILAAVSYTLASYFENLTLTGGDDLEGTGNSLANIIKGNTGNNILTGNDGNDTLDGGAGDDDTLNGGAGDDLYVVDSDTDTIIEANGEGTDTVAASVTFSIAALDDVENLTLSGSGSINGTGNADVNTLTGNGGENTLDGGAGDDVLAGGGGSDTYIIDSAGDSVDEEEDNGADTVSTALSWTLGDNVENLVLTGSGDVNGTGNALGNTLTGNGGANTLSGMDGKDTLDGDAGADVMAGGADDDTYIVDHASDVVSEAGSEGTDFVRSGISYTLGSHVENLVLTGVASINGAGNSLANVITGNTGANVITGNGGDDTLDGGGGEGDTLVGGAGNDVYIINSLSDTIVEVYAEGTDTVKLAATFSLEAYTYIENLTLTGTLNIDGTGNSFNNILTGNSGVNSLFAGNGADTLDGGEGADTLAGGAGSDYYIVDNLGDVVTEEASAGTDTVATSVSYTIADSDVENIILTGTGDIGAAGNSSVNILTGNAGNNMLDGAAGADTMAGGLGDDTYVVDNAGDVVTEKDGEGADTVMSSITYTLGATIENLVLTGSVNGAGNALDNVITGSSSSNSLSGGDGHDRLSGGGSADTLVGGTGNDTLDGGTGIDAMTGGTGDDVYYVDSSSDTVTENTLEGSDTVNSRITYTLGSNLENLTLIGYNKINGTGNALDNIMRGDENASKNTLAGGTGNDTYYVGAGDVVLESASSGTDTVYSALSTYTMSNQVEILRLLDGGIAGVGNSLANTMFGNSGDNTLEGGSDIYGDTLVGGDGDDIYYMDERETVIEYEGGGNDTVILDLENGDTYTLASWVENLIVERGTVIGNDLANTIIAGSAGGERNDIYGGAGNDIIDGGTNGGDKLYGEDGNDILYGGGGDSLVGGLGDDIYYLYSADDGVIENANEGTDTVMADMSYSMEANIEIVILTSAGGHYVSGNTGNDTLIGNSGADQLDGYTGDDVMRGMAGNDILDEFGTGADTLDGGTGNDTLVGRGGNDTYIYSAGLDVINEVNSGSNDTLWISGGITINDTYASVLSSHLKLVFYSGLNEIRIHNYNTAAGYEVEIIKFDDGFETTLAGWNSWARQTENADSYTGTTGDNVVIGMANADTLNGGDGNDALHGGSERDTLDGGNGNDLLVGGTNADVMTGGTGDDIFSVDQTDDELFENSGEGTDTVKSFVGWTLGTHFENLTLMGSDNINATGNGSANILVGNSGNNTLDGLTGADGMAGGMGDDTYIIDNTSDTVTETVHQGTDTIQSSVTYTLSSYVENMALTGSSAIHGTGNTSDNVLTGNSGANTLSGLDGNDTLDGGVGADVMLGGTGNDVYIVDDAGDSLTESSGSGTDSVRSSVSFTLGTNVETLVLTGSGNLAGTGNSGVNTITGNAGNNTLDGSGGADSLAGGAGDDIYLVDDMGDIVLEAQGAGIDSVQSTASGYTLASNVDNLILGGSSGINGTGNDLANSITGNSGVNVLTGGGGNDTLDGGTGADTLLGGAGNDVFIVDNASDLVSENASEGTDTVQVSVSYTISDADVENLVLTGSGAINGTGNSVGNTLTGNSGANTLTGGAGDDVYIVGSGDVVVESSGQGADTVMSDAGFTLSSYVENLVLTGSGSVNGAGNTLDNTLTGNAGVNTLTGGAGNDVYIIDGTADTVAEMSGEGTDLIIASSAAGMTTTLGAYVENLTLAGTLDLNGAGNSAVNTLTGNSGSNTLDGGGGADAMLGGLGDDVYIVDDAGDSLTEATDAGIDAVIAGVTWTLAGNVEYLTLSGSGSVNGTGNSLDNIVLGNSGSNTLYGLDGSDVLDGGANADVMLGGLGDDIYTVDNAGDTVTELSGQGTDTVHSSISWTLGGYIENLVLTGTAAINAAGNSLANTITGNGGVNTLTGGAGNDTYIVGSGDMVAELSGEGTDTVIATSGGYTLDAYVENLVVANGAAGTGNAEANTITGNAAANTLAGAAGNDTLDGGVGDDTLDGGAGDDVFIVDSAGDLVAEGSGDGTDLVRAGVTYTIADNDVENLTLIGTANIGATGNVSVNILTGNSGSNSLNGAAGADTMVGGAGSDAYVVDNVGDVVSEAADEGTDSVYADVSWTLGSNFENIVLTGSSSTNATGNTLNNILTGNEGANTLAGLGGDDIYVVGAGDIVTEASSQGTDEVRSSVTWTLGSDFENLTLTGSDINGVGNTLGNTITGSSGANSLSGLGGNDVIRGGLGNDVLDGGDGNDTLDGGSGADTMTGGIGNDIFLVDSLIDVVSESAAGGVDTVQTTVSYTLGAELENLTLTGSSVIHGTGNSGANILTGNGVGNSLNGGSGNDTLDGGAGNDLLTGGLDADIFLFSTASLGGIDNLTDYSIAQHDVLDVSDLLIGYTGTVTNWVRITDDAGNSNVEIDRDGTGLVYGWTKIGTLTGVTGLTNEVNLLNAGSLVVL